MNKSYQAYRHGENLLLKIDKLPKGLKVVKTKIFAVGSHGNNHSIDTGKLYFVKEDKGVYGYLSAKKTSLFHPEHSPKGVKIEDGFYKLIKQVEFTPSGLIPVID